MNDLILIDTSAWIDFFHGVEPVAELVDEALADGSAALCGMVELEIRHGTRGKNERLLSGLTALPRIPTQEQDYALAGDMLAALRRKGVTIPGTDGLIAHLAIRHDLPLLDHDAHFAHVPRLKRVWTAP